MSRRTFAAVVMLFLGVVESGHAQTKQTGQAAPQGLLKTWSGAICNGKISVSITFTDIKADKLIGSARDQFGSTSNFLHDGTGSGAATWNVGTLTIETTAALGSYKLVGGKLIGTYARKPGFYDPNNRMGCPQQEQVAFQ
jgi:hypothetical protein